jgi:glycosyltransferase involved in cell wall biosynthesis
MKVEAYILNWNEIDIIRLTIKHYQSFCSRIVIYDNYSDDGSDLVAQEMGCQVIKFGTPGELNDGDYIKVKNNCWKGSNADWVIVCDADEILIVDSSALRFATEKKLTIIKTQGWNVYSNKYVKNDYSEITTGFEDNQYSKLVCFNPKEIKEINYVYGCHEANPIGKLVYQDYGTVYLMHYRCIGGVERLINRHEQYKKRLSALNKRWNLGIHYLQSNDQKRADFEERLKRSVTLF